MDFKCLRLGGGREIIVYFFGFIVYWSFGFVVKVRVLF